ncbi:MAG: ABC transporter substrate-binding protein [Synergistaceae bacterium]|jgi:branched-chain amino acid transport system substrate-binding protein|nr:ABC transporter substrate-binding protein [Synergistaceae bacterium]
MKKVSVKKVSVKKVRSFWKGVLTALAVLLCTAGMGWAADAEPIRIGYLAALTGDGSVWGQSEEAGARLCVKHINEKGGLLGRPVELVCYDTRGKPDDALNSVRRMIFEDKVVAVGGSNYSSIQLAIASVVDRGQVPAVASAATNPAVTVDPATGKVRPYMFRIAYTDPYQGRVIADYLVEKCGARKIAILGDIGDAYSEGLTEFIRSRADELKVEHRFWAFRGGDVDFRAQLTEARNWGADAVAMTMLYKEMGLVIKQAVESGWKPHFMGGDGVSPNIFEIAGNEAMEGSFWIQAMSYTDPKVLELNAVYEKDFGKRATEPTNLVAAYDIVQFIADAITRAGKAEGPAIRDAMEETKDLQVTHFRWTVDKATHNPLNKPAAVHRGTNGQLVFTEYWAPQDRANQ